MEKRWEVDVFNEEFYKRANTAMVERLNELYEMDKPHHALYEAVRWMWETMLIQANGFVVVRNKNINYIVEKLDTLGFFGVKVSKRGRNGFTGETNLLCGYVGNEDCRLWYVNESFVEAVTGITEHDAIPEWAQDANELLKEKIADENIFDRLFSVVDTDGNEDCFKLTQRLDWEVGKTKIKFINHK